MVSETAPDPVLNYPCPYCGTQNHMLRFIRVAPLANDVHSYHFICEGCERTFEDCNAKSAAEGRTINDSGLITAIQLIRISSKDR